IHTIKGASGFLGFDKLTALTHAAESLLSGLRDGALTLNPNSTAALFATVDSVRAMLRAIESTGQDGTDDHAALIVQLQKLQKGESVDAAPAAPPAIETSPAAAPVTETAAAVEPPVADVVAEAAAPAEVTVTPDPEGVAPADAAVGTPAPVEEKISPVPVEEAPVAAHPVPTPVPEPVPAVAEPVAVHDESAIVQEATAVVEEAAAVAAGAATSGGAEADDQPAPAAKAPAESAGTAAPSTIRVGVSLLDKLMNLVGELVLARNQVLQCMANSSDATFLATAQRLNLITTELQESVMKTRMQPIGTIWNKFPRVVRDLALMCGKEARLEMEGAETELDRTLIEAITDPLTHLVRNAVDHGVESPEARRAAGKPAQGRISLRAFHEGGHVNIEIADDGNGISVDRIRDKARALGLLRTADEGRMTDREVLSLIFAPGFSTAAQVTDISGRGVGMDVVKTNIERIGGTVDIASEVGGGTTFRVKIPLTLAIIPALMVHTGGDRYAIPQVNLVELVRLKDESSSDGIEYVHGVPVHRLRGNLLPLVDLAGQLGLRDSSAGPLGRDGTVSVVVLQALDQQFGLVVEEISDTEEIVVKPLGQQVKHLDTYAGATILGDGRVALILDVLGLARRSGVIADVSDRGATEERVEREADDSVDAQTLLVVEVGAQRRMAIPLSAVSRLEEFDPTEVEVAGRVEVIQYRGRILPLVRVGGTAGTSTEEGVRLPLVVHEDERGAVGLVVDTILDIVEEQVMLDTARAGAGLLGSAIVSGRVTDVIDVPALVDATMALGVPA
ncbi:MAG TPA: chemotaxis protein CheA, partial [Acidimicrobiales bacterium]|nr:chemotaxis protein CheA [Acidimicrobiales bacterium]